MPIYTRTGDKGKTSLFDGTRVLKSHVRVDTYGTIDELNSMIGVVLAELRAENRERRTDLPAGPLRLVRIEASKAGSGELRAQLESIQHDLFAIGSALATPHPLPVPSIATRPQDFEKLIDELTEKLPAINYFILPGGGKAGSILHVARTIARRVERQLVALMQIEEIDETIVKYVNRLSDLLFTMARYVNHVEGKEEIKWMKK